MTDPLGFNFPPVPVANAAGGLPVTYPMSALTPQDVGAAAAGATGQASDAGHAHAHGNQLGGTLHANVASSAGFMSVADKGKLDGIQTQGASVAIAALTVDWSLGKSYSKTLAGGANALLFSNATDGQEIKVAITGATSTMTFPSGLVWPAGSPPTQTSVGTDLYTFTKIGTKIFARVDQAYA